MANVVDKRNRRKRAHKRIRNRVSGTSERPRLAVFKSGRYVYAQLIDDLAGSTVAQANSREADVVKGLESSAASMVAARAVGETIAERAKAQGIERCVFDRGGYLYHGKVKELADGARSSGLEF
jgi:large subunit ribosomal protein L18